MYRARSLVSPAEADDAVAAIDAADAVEHAGLAGAVRPDQGEQLAVLDCKRDIVEHGQSAETQAQVFDPELSHTTSATFETA